MQILKVIMFLGIFIPILIFGENKITPTDVYSKVQYLLSEIELIRKEMGKVENKKDEIKVKNVRPREVYFQALSVLKKINILLFEHLRVDGIEPKILNTEPLPKDVFKVISGSINLIQKVKNKLKIPEISKFTEYREKTPTDVYITMVKVDRELNILLDKKFSPSEVYEIITTSINYMSIILRKNKNSIRVPKDIEYKRFKTPKDVYKLLTECYLIIAKEFPKFNIEVMNIDLTLSQNEIIKPNNVYELASLILSEISYLYQEMNLKKEPYRAIYSGKKIPSQVYQRVGILKKQLIQLKDLNYEK